MNIKIEVDESISDTEVVIRCRELSDEILVMQKQLLQSAKETLKIEAEKNGVTYYLSLGEIIFFETNQNQIAVHTVDQIYMTRFRLHELEDMLPGKFVRVSKSAIINISKLHSICKNITGASEVTFLGSHKKTFVSRNYYRMLMEKIKEKRLSL